MKILFALVLTFLATTLPGCSPKAPPQEAPPKAEPKIVVVPKEAAALPAALQHELMTAIYGDEYDVEKGRAFSIVIDEAQQGDEAESAYYLLTYHSAGKLRDGRLAVLVNGCPADEEGGDASSHAAGGSVNIFYLRKEGAKWVVTDRHENVAVLGSNGSFSRARWGRLGPGEDGLLVSGGGTWFGHTISDVTVFSLGPKVTELGAFSEMSSNGGACEPGTEECWEVDGDIRMVAPTGEARYFDILVDFKVKKYTVVEDKAGNYIEQLKSDTRQPVTYRFKSGKLVTISGANPVPGI